MHVLSRILPIESRATKDIFISAVRFATSVEPPCPTWENKLRISAQEQAAYMLVDRDDDMQSIMSDNEVKFEIRSALSRVFSLFEAELLHSPCTENVDKISESMQDLEWIWGILLKMDMTEEFVTKWIDISETLIRTVEDEGLKRFAWGLKVKIAELTSKALDAVGYGNVIVPSPRRVQLLQAWLPFVRKLKPGSDTVGEEHIEFQHKMDDELCEGIEGAIVALVSGLPSSDQANVLEDWLRSGRLEYPDLSEAFEVWCFRTKSATRRLFKVSDVVDQNQNTDAV